MSCPFQSEGSLARTSNYFDYLKSGKEHEKNRCNGGSFHPSRIAEGGYMNHPLAGLPERQSVVPGVSVELPLAEGGRNVFIEHIISVHGFVIFFGKSEGENVHGYLDFDVGTGCLKTEE